MAHPTRGVISPGIVLPGGSEDRTLALTERVILAALRACALFAVQGISIKLAVNAAKEQLLAMMQRRLVDNASGAGR